MAKVKIIFRKEIHADLNEFYPNFPGSLRKQIDNALFKMMGGQAKDPGEKKISHKGVVSTTGACEAIILKRTPKKCERSNSKVFALLTHYEPGHEYMKDDVLKKAVNNYDMESSNVIHNLLRQGYFEMEK